MPQLRLCLQTQTPLVRPLADLPAGAALEDLTEERDYLLSPGGVTRMLSGLAIRLREQRRTSRTTWVSLSKDPARLSWRGGALDLITLPQDEMDRYAAAKSAFWEELHALSGPSDRASVAEGLAILARAVGDRSRALHAQDPFDLFYTHDFQLLAVGRELPAEVPRAFRWHGPIRPMSAPMRDYVARSLETYDAVIVSTQAYARELRSWGVRAPIHASYPYLDESARRVVTDADVAAFDERYGLGPDEVAFVIVARMDPIKSQDVAIRALARIAHRAPEAKLVLVGGGGFSGGRQGLGLAQAVAWRAHLERLALDLGIADRVVFTGGVTDPELDVALTRARAVILPSALEGFGLATIEGWLYGKPALVSQGAGVAELVRDGENGYTFQPGDDLTLAEAMLDLAQDVDQARLLGAEGRRSARACHLGRGSDEVWKVLRSVQPRATERERTYKRRW